MYLKKKGSRKKRKGGRRKLGT